VITPEEAAAYKAMRPLPLTVTAKKTVNLAVAGQGECCGRK
jgi:hypothetical protein